MKKGFDPHNSSSGRASRILVESVLSKNPKCVKCQKKLNLKDPCINNSVKGFKIGKSLKTSNTFSSLPFGLLSGMFIDTPYHPLCHKCDKDVKRFIGFIPEQHDDKWFPQVTTPWLKIEDVPEGKSRWTIRYRGKNIPHTKALKTKFMNEGVRRYKKRYPECPHSTGKLKRLLNGYKLYDKQYWEF